MLDIACESLLFATAEVDSNYMMWCVPCHGFRGCLIKMSDVWGKVTEAGYCVIMLLAVLLARLGSPAAHPQP